MLLSRCVAHAELPHASNACIGMAVSLLPVGFTAAFLIPFAALGFTHTTRLHLANCVKQLLEAETRQERLRQEQEAKAKEEEELSSAESTRTAQSCRPSSTHTWTSCARLGRPRARQSPTWSTRGRWSANWSATFQTCSSHGARPKISSLTPGTSAITSSPISRNSTELSNSSTSSQNLMT